MHAGSLKYAAKRAKRDSREIERAVQGFSKAINIAMREKRLDQTTLDYFKWKNGRMIVSEIEELNGTRTKEMATDPAIIKRDKYIKLAIRDHLSNNNTYCCLTSLEAKQYIKNNRNCLF